MKLFRLIPIISLILVSGTHPALATPKDFKVSVYPAIVDIDMDSYDDQIVRSVNISHNLDDTIPIELSISELTIEDTSIEYESIVDDVSVQDSIIIISGDEKKTVNIQITKPTDFKSKTYGASLLIKPVLPDTYFYEHGIRLTPFISVPILISFDRQDLKGDLPLLESFNSSYSVFDGKSHLALSAKNPTDYYKNIKEVVKIEKLISGEKVFEGKVNQSFHPEEQLTKDMYLDLESYGLFKATYRIYDNNDIALRSTIYLSFSWMHILIGVVLLALSSLYIIHSYGQVRKKSDKRSI